ncbi:MAG: ABC transporter ATP-binding protein, partial [Synergistaceae bacterium]|nr:ABC transporter ATP-binding protein [Synergistaceae bacterium]
MSGVTRWLYTVPEKKKYYILALTLIQAFAGSLGVIYALLFRNGIDSAVRKDAKTFHHYISLIIILVLVQISVSMIIRWLHELAAADIENTFKSRLMSKILRKEYASVSAIHTAEWLNRLTSDTKVVAGGYVEILPGLSEMIVRLFSALVMIVVLDKWFAYVLIPSGIIFVAFTYGFRRILRQLHKSIQEQDGKLRIFLQERIGSLVVIKSFGAEDQTQKEAAERMTSHKTARMRRNYFSNFCNAGFGFVMHGIYLVSVIYCANGIMTGTVSYGTLTAIMQLIGQIQAPYANISGYLPKYYAMT